MTTLRRLLLLVPLAGLTTGCAQAADPATPAVPAAPAASSTAARDDAAIYTAVLRRYLGTPAENSFPDLTFSTVYVMDRTDPGGTTIPPDVQHRLAAAVTGVEFIADRATVLEQPGGCPRVKAGAILVTLGEPTGPAEEVEVPINGFVGCTGATWLTYVVHREPDGWRVLRTTGTKAIA